MKPIGTVDEYRKSFKLEERMLGVLAVAAAQYSASLGHDDKPDVSIKGYVVRNNQIYDGWVDTSEIVKERKVLDIYGKHKNVPEAMLATVACAATLVGSDVMVINDEIFYIEGDEVYSARFNGHGCSEVSTQEA